MCAVRAVREVSELIVRGNAVDSPSRLMLSGDGPGAQLQGFGIPVDCDSPGGGSILVDHCCGRVSAQVQGEFPINRVERGLAPRVPSGAPCLEESSASAIALDGVNGGCPGMCKSKGLTPM